jgi:hypothetical protein
MILNFPSISTTVMGTRLFKVAAKVLLDVLISSFEYTLVVLAFNDKAVSTSF